MITTRTSTTATAGSDAGSGTAREGATVQTVGELPTERLEAETVTLARRLSSGTYELLALVGE